MNKGWDVTIVSSEPRIVVCEKCEAEYVYILEVSGSGSQGAWLGFQNEGAKKKAEKKAQKDVREQLRTNAEAVPCPECAHYQDHMISVAKKQHAGILTLATIILVIGGPILGFILLITKAGDMLWLWAGLAGIVLGLFTGLGAYYQYSSFEPNEQPKKTRFAIADEKAMLRDDFEATADDANVKSLTKAQRKNKGSVDIIVWVDEFQIKDEETVAVKLPDGSTAKIELDRDVRKGDTFAFQRNLDDGPMEFSCVIHIYNEYHGK